MFNSCFVSAWRETRHYQQWCSEGPYPQLLHISPCHPNAGHLSISDVRIRLQHSLLGGDRSRRINQTIASTGTAVKQTKEAVGKDFFISFPEDYKSHIYTFFYKSLFFYYYYYYFFWSIISFPEDYKSRFFTFIQQGCIFV